SPLRRRGLTWAGLALALLVTALVYWPGTHGGFLLDDYPNIVDNPAMQSVALTAPDFLRAATSTHTGPLDRPIAMMSLALNAHFTGLDPRAMKLTNLAIHLLNGVLVFLLLRLLLREYVRLKDPVSSSRAADRGSRVPILQWTALAVTAAWLLAPINLTSVLYTVQRMTSLAATFTLAALIVFVLARRWLFDQRRRIAAIVLLLVAALILVPLATLTKESGVLTLLYALVIEWVFFRFRNHRKESTAAAPSRGSESVKGPVAWTSVAYFTLFLLLPLILGLLWIAPGVLSPGAWAARDFTLGERLLTEGRVLWHYIYWTLVPNIQVMSLYHDAFPVSRGLFSPWGSLPAWIGIAALLAAGFACARRWPLIGFGLLWFLAGQVLTASFIPLELVFEHREYLPSLGLFVAVLTPLLLARPRKRFHTARIGAACALVLLYAGGLSLRSLDWSNPLVQAAIAAQTHPDSPRATYGYGRTLLALSRRDPALVPKAEQALEKARRVPGQGILPLSALILLAHETHSPMRLAWFRDMAAKLRARPPNAQDIGALNALVRCAVRDKDACVFPSGAMTTVFATALQSSDSNDYVMAIYGNYLLNVLDRPQTAASIFRVLARRHPRDAGYHFSLGVCLAASGDGIGARAELAKLRRLNRYGIHDPDVRKLDQLVQRLYPAVP
ncbi:MAG: tetratricopeptide repeat protein, partial [Acetobacteraceae bacterium]